MATRAKVYQYFVSSGAEENYKMITQGTMAQIAAKLSSDGKEDLAFIAKVQERLCERTYAKVVDHVANMIGDMFTDEELDQVIAFNQLPVAKKFRDMMPKMQQAMVNFLIDGNLVTETMIDEIIDELEVELPKPVTH